MEQRVLDSGKSVPHASLADNDVACLVYVEHRHSVDRARWVIARRWIPYVVRANYKDYVSLSEFAVDLFHVEKLIVRHVRFRGQNVHVARHATGYGVKCA